MKSACGILLNGSLNLVGFQASGTDINVLDRAVDNRLDPSYVGLPCSVGASVGVGDFYTEGNALSADITLCHFLYTSENCMNIASFMRLDIHYNRYYA